MLRLEVNPRGLALAGGVLAGLWLLARLWPVVLLVIVSLMFAAALLPFMEWMVRRGCHRAAAVLVLVVIMVALTALIGLLVAPVVIEQGKALADRIPALRDGAARFIERQGAVQLGAEVRAFSPGEAIEPGQVTSAGRRVLGVVTSIITIIVLTAYILYDARRIERFVYFATPVRFHEHISNLLSALQRVVGGYIRGQLVTSGFITVFTFVTLTVLGIPNALALAVLAGIADMIPMIGVFLAVGPATLAALSVSLPTAILVAGLLMAYQEFENRFLVQRVYGATLRLPAIAVLVALLAGAELLGVAGALLSLPAAAALRVFIEYGYDMKRGRLRSDAAPPEDPFAPDTAAARAANGRARVRAAEPREAG